MEDTLAGLFCAQSANAEKIPPITSVTAKDRMICAATVDIPSQLATMGNT